MKVSESPPDKERLRLIRGVTADAAALLGIDLSIDTPKSIMTKVNDAIVDLVFGKPTPVSQDENPHLLLHPDGSAVWLVLGRRRNRRQVQ
jgi:hypothetical protein